MVSRRRGLLAALAAAVLGLSAGAPESVAEFGDTRTISFYHIHTKETLTITYKRDGKYVPAALKKINWIMRDWRENEEIAIDPKTIDLLWEMHTELRSKKPIHIICGYRSAKTNNMLRRTVGGQAKRSYHIRGKAIDATFPDVPVKQMRYSALVRQMGGVGYYPNSGIPFVHVDSGPVRAWPRLPRYELAMLFPSGTTKHKPSGGGHLRRSDVQKARKNHKKVASQVAAFFELRNRPHTPTELAVAALGPVKPPAPQLAKRPPTRVASLSPRTVPPPPAPALAPAPRHHVRPPPQRPQRTASLPSNAERARLNQLVSLASLTTSDLPRASRPPEADRRRLNDLFSSAAVEISGPASPKRPVSEPKGPKEPKDSNGKTRLAALDQSALMAPSAVSPRPKASITDSETGWVPQTEFDDDHPEELSYRPFPIAPLLTESASADDAALVTLVHPDVTATLDLIDADDITMPLRLRPGRQVTQVMWAQQFRGDAVDLSAIEHAGRSLKPPAGLASRSVKTTAR